MKTMLRSSLLLGLILFQFSCNSNKNDVDVTGEPATARILRVSCRGTVMEVKSPGIIGEDWNYYSDITEPFDPSNPTITYKNCVLVSHVPKDLQNPGATISFIYLPGLGPGNHCDLGGLPRTEITLTSVRD